MGHALGEILPLAFAAAIRPATIVAVVLLLGTPHARANGLSFAVGFMTSFAVMGTVLLVIADVVGAIEEGQPATWASILKLILGGLFLVAAYWIWRSRPKPGTHIPMPKWVERLDGLTPGRALGFGAAAGVVNGKNLIITMAAAAYIAETGIRVSEQILTLAVYLAIAGCCVLAPLAVYLVAGDRAKEPLDRLRVWMVDYTPAIMSTLFLIIGVMLIGDGIGGLS